MRILYPTTQTRQFYQQNALSRSLVWAAPNTAPHGDTTRGTYTVPENKRAVITCVWLQVRRATVAAPVGVVRLTLDANINSVYSYFGSVYLTTNLANDLQQLSIPCQIWLGEGDDILIKSSDSSTGGTVSYVSSVEYMEFDG